MMISELWRMLPVSRGAIVNAKVDAKVDGCIVSAMRAAFYRIVPA
jgi:hypothetical protein